MIIIGIPLIQNAIFKKRKRRGKGGRPWTFSIYFLIFFTHPKDDETSGEKRNKTVCGRSGDQHTVKHEISETEFDRRPNAFNGRLSSVVWCGVVWGGVVRSVKFE